MILESKLHRINVNSRQFYFLKFFEKLKAFSYNNSIHYTLSYSVSISFRLELIEPSAREDFIRSDAVLSLARFERFFSSPHSPSSLLSSPKNKHLSSRRL